MFTAQTCLVRVSPNMHILSPVVSFLLRPRTHRLSHNLAVSFASCSDNRVSCINYWLSSTPEQERESRYLPVPPACRYRPLPAAPRHSILNPRNKCAWLTEDRPPQCLAINGTDHISEAQIKERFRGAGKMARWLRAPQTWLPTRHLTTVSNCGNLICLSAQTHRQAKHPYT